MAKLGTLIKWAGWSVISKRWHSLAEYSKKVTQKCVPFDRTLLLKIINEILSLYWNVFWNCAETWGSSKHQFFLESQKPAEI